MKLQQLALETSLI